ncbi:MAG: hypothetical protein QM692_06385, partial [Thermomicrobiales bacterium]
MLLDASVLINFAHIQALGLLLSMETFRPATTRVVASQVLNETGRQQVQFALRSGSIELVDELIPAGLLPLVPGWVRRFGEQDTSLLINALVLQATLGTDDRRLRTEAQRRGVASLATTEDLLAELILARRLSLRQGNLKLVKLREVRFRAACELAASLRCWSGEAV